jgi:hypothetical protein
MGRASQGVSPTARPYASYRARCTTGPLGLYSTIPILISLLALLCRLLAWFVHMIDDTLQGCTYHSFGPVRPDLCLTESCSLVRVVMCKR